MPKTQTVAPTLNTRTAAPRLPANVTLSAGDLTPPKREGSDQWAVLAGVRFLLALTVMLHHLSVHLPDTDLLRNADFGGLSSVLGFFLISGYSMANSLSRDADTKRFYERRFWRIYPTYLFAITLAMVPAILFGTVLAGARPGFSDSPDAHQFLLASIFMQGFVTPGDLPANGVIWSLSCEVWLYAVSPLLFRAPLRWLQAVALCSIGVYVAHDYFDSNPYYADADGIAFLSFAWAFIAGFAYYRFADKVGSTLGFVLAGVALCCVNGERYGPINFALVIAAVAMARCIRLNPRWRRPLIFAGSLSYPLYLVHVPVINMAVGLGYSNGIAIVCAALLLAAAVRICIEAPIEWYQRRHGRLQSLNVLVQPS